MDHGSCIAFHHCQPRKSIWLSFSQNTHWNKDLWRWKDPKKHVWKKLARYHNKHVGISGKTRIHGDYHALHWQRMGNKVCEHNLQMSSISSLKCSIGQTFCLVVKEMDPVLLGSLWVVTTDNESNDYTMVDCRHHPRYLWIFLHQLQVPHVLVLLTPSSWLLKTLSLVDFKIQSEG